MNLARFDARFFLCSLILGIIAFGAFACGEPPALNRCKDIVCESPPPERCDGNDVVINEAEGTCDDLGVCNYEVASRETCSGETPYCRDGECVGEDPCADVTCDPSDVPEPYCDGNDAVVFDPNSGECVGGQCAYYEASRETCSEETPYCRDGECVRAEWQHGEIVALTPGMFGLESFGTDPNPRLFDTVDNQPAYASVNHGDVIPVGEGNVFSGRNSSGNPMLADTSVGNARHPFDTKRYHIDGKSFLTRPYALQYGHSFERKLFVEWWVRFEEGHTAGGAGKHIRIWADNSGDRRYSSWTNNPSYIMGRSWWSSGLRNRTDWMRLTAELDTSSEDVLEWRGRYWVDGVLEVDHFRPEVAELGNHPELDWGPPAIGLIGFDPRSPAEDFGAEWRQGRLTDIYMSVGPERFAITDSATYDPTSNYEVQEIITWAPEQVLIKVFAGALGDLAGKHLHFVGSGNAAQGTAHTILAP